MIPLLTSLYCHVTGFVTSAVRGSGILGAGFTTLKKKRGRSTTSVLLLQRSTLLSTTDLKFYLAFNYSQENSFPIYLLFNKMINSCNVKLQQRHLADIYEKLAHSMPITMQCGGKPQNSLTLTANNSGLKPLKLEKYHIFGILRTSAFTGSYPGQVIPVQNFE